MKLNEYIEKARSTAIYPNMGSNLYYPTLGLCGECSEVLSKILVQAKIAEILKELGDVMWYVANLSIEYGISLDDEQLGKIDYPDKEYAIINIAQTLCVNSGIIAEASKKIMRDSNGVITDEKFDIVYDSLLSIIMNVSAIADILTSDIDEVMEMNIRKLFSRKARGQLKGDGDNR